MLILTATFYAFLAILLLLGIFIGGLIVGARYGVDKAIKALEDLEADRKSGIHTPKKDTFQQVLERRLVEINKRQNNLK